MVTAAFCRASRGPPLAAPLSAPGPHRGSTGVFYPYLRPPPVSLPSVSYLLTGGSLWGRRSPALSSSSRLSLCLYAAPPSPLLTLFLRGAFCFWDRFFPQPEVLFWLTPPISGPPPPTSSRRGIPWGHRSPALSSSSRLSLRSQASPPSPRLARLLRGAFCFWGRFSTPGGLVLVHPSDFGPSASYLVSKRVPWGHRSPALSSSPLSSAPRSDLSTT